MSGDDNLIPPMQDGGRATAPTSGNAMPSRPVDYREVQPPAEVDVRHIDEAADTWAESAQAKDAAVARLATAFGDFANTWADKKMAAKGTAQGASDALAGKIQPQSGLMQVIASPYTNAYDAAAHLTYSNETQTAVATSMDRLEQDHAGDPNGFAGTAQAAAAAAVKQAPTAYQPEVAQMYAQRITAGVTRLRGQAIENTKSSAVDSYLSTVDSRINSAIQTASQLPDDQQTAIMGKLGTDNKAQLAVLVQAGAITQGRADLLAQKFSDSAEAAVHQNYTTNVVNHFIDYARSGDVDAADNALHAYLNDPANTDADKAAITKQYLSQMDDFSKAQSRLHANDIAGVGQQLTAGKYGQDIEPQINQLYKIGAISPEMLHSLMSQSMHNQLSAVTDNSTNQLIDAAVHGGQKLDPTDKAVVKAADVYFKTHVAISGVPPLSDAWTLGAANFARGTNIIPPSVLSTIRVGLISGDPTKAAYAAAAGERIRLANPQIDPYNNDPRAASLANEINQNLHAGMNPTQAYQLATQHANLPKDQREIIEKNYAGLLRQDPGGNTKALQSALDSQIPAMFGHGKAPPAPVALQAEYNQLVSTYYGANGGNLDAARTLAARQVQSTWGVSRMNGQPELTKYPPERLGVTSDAIRSDVASSVKSAGYSGDPSQVHLVPTPETDASRGRTWGLVHTDPTTGLSDVLLDHQNRPLRYSIPSGPDFVKQRQALIEEHLAAARQQRAEQRQNSGEQMHFEEQLSSQYLSGDPQQRAQAGR